MMVTFVSQCEKKALKRTRRVLDSFADRIGDNTWQTIITGEGLEAVKKLLRKTASKSTAVSCHWIRSRSRTELMWVVGNRDRFNDRGVVPVHYTESGIDQYMDSGHWKTMDVIKYASAIAALFHDFGKATVLFQQKIDPDQQTESFEPYRHEWVSLRAFQAFVGTKDDLEWLEGLAQLDIQKEFILFKDGIDGKVEDNHPIAKSSPLAQLVSWLIVSHHKLPLYPKWQKENNSEPKFSDISNWMEGSFDADWNSYKCKQVDQKERLGENWQIVDDGLPFNSSYWRSYACLLASKAKIALKPLLTQDDWLNGMLFTSHISRLALVLADHHYSAKKETEEQWRSEAYKVWANSYSDKETKALKQRLDEHLIGVSHNAQKIAKALPKLNGSLNSIKTNSFLENKVAKIFKDDFGWQDEATKVADAIAKTTIEQGFFGINMASTGKGKTLANAKIMNAIGNVIGRTRFSVALGLRTLTLQTGKEYREKIGLDDEELAIMVGGAAIKQLFENEQNIQKNKLESSDIYEAVGSESLEEPLDTDVSVNFKGGISKHSLSEWTKQEKDLDNLINAPVLVCTIDHLVPATESTSGGRHMAPMLRLLTSDLVLDEPDDFGLEDLPALCRLVYWAGMMGSRVLLSTATMPPSLSYALFLAYQNGWLEYAKASLDGQRGVITCAWFDEFSSESNQISTQKEFQGVHEKFVKKRVKNLTLKSPQKRKGKIIDIAEDGENSALERLTQTIHEGILQLHNDHHQSKNDVTISFGLIRMANIDPLVAMGTRLLSIQPPEDTCIHYCIYHSRFPLAVRSYIERQLDTILKRQNPDEIWNHIDDKIRDSNARHHIFVVLASPVAEVGRDHDYDWAIVEPSSMRSIIQLAGRILRHRDIDPEHPNILLLNKNYRALKGEPPCLVRPGFEIKGLSAQNGYDLKDILQKEQYEVISSIPRILAPSNEILEGESWGNLVDLEHMALTRQLFTGEKPANVWWKNHPQWCGEVQRQQPFRKSDNDEPYYLWIRDEQSKPKWQWKNEHVKPVKFGEPSSITLSNFQPDTIASRNEFWFDLDALTIYKQLATELKIDTLEEISRRFGEVRLRENNNESTAQYYYHPNFGVFQKKDEE